MSRKIVDAPIFTIPSKQNQVSALESGKATASLGAMGPVGITQNLKTPTLEEVNDVYNDITAQRDKDRLSAQDTKAQRDALTRGIFDELYKRGINLLRPEIIATTEFIPLSESGEESKLDTPLSLKYGEDRSVQINQIVRLIELHRLINLAVNKSAADFIDKVALPEVGNISQITEFNLRNRINEEVEGLENIENVKKLFTSITVSDYIRIFSRIWQFLSEGFTSSPFFTVNVWESDLESTINNFKSILTSFGTSSGAAFNPVNFTSGLLAERVTADSPELKLQKLSMMRSLLFEGETPLIQTQSFKAILGIVIMQEMMDAIIGFAQKTMALHKSYKDGVDLSILEAGFSPSSAQVEDYAKIYNNTISKRYPLHLIRSTHDSKFIDNNELFTLTSEEFANSLLGVSDTASATSNIQMLWNCFSRLYSDVHCFDYATSDAIGIYKTDTLTTSTNFNLRDNWVKNISRVGAYSFDNDSSGRIKRIDRPSDIDPDNFNEAVLAASGYDKHQHPVNPIDAHKAGQSMLKSNNDLDWDAGSVIGGEINYLTDYRSNNDDITRLMTLAEHVACVFWDLCVDQNIFKMNSGIGTSKLFGEGESFTSFEDYMKKATGYPRDTIYGSEEGAGVYSDKQTIDSKFKFRNLSSELNISNGKITNLGKIGEKLLIPIEGDNNTYILPSETRNTGINNVVSGPEFIIRQALATSDYEFRFFEDYIADLESTIESFCDDVIRITGLDSGVKFYPAKGSTHPSNKARVGKSTANSDALYLFQEFFESVSDALAAEKYSSDYEVVALFTGLKAGSDSELSKDDGTYQCLLEASYFGSLATLNETTKFGSDSNQNASKLLYDALVDDMGQKASDLNFERGDNLLTINKAINDNSTKDTSATIYGARHRSEAEKTDRIIDTGEPGDANDTWNQIWFEAFCAHFDDNDGDSGKHTAVWDRPPKTPARWAWYHMDSNKSGLHSDYRDHITGRTDHGSTINGLGLIVEVTENSGTNTGVVNTDKLLVNNAWYTDGPLKTNHAQRSLILWTYITKLLHLTTSMKINMNVDPEYYDEGQIVISFIEEYFYALRKVLQGISPEFGDEFEEDGVFSDAPNSHYEALIGQTFLRLVERAINARYENVAKRLRGLLTHVQDLKGVHKYLVDFFDPENFSDKLKTSINFANNNYQSITGDSNVDILSKMLPYLSKDYINMLSKQKSQLISTKERHEIFNPVSDITGKQVKLMNIALSRKNVGYLSSEKRGKKSVFHVGVPSRMIESLRLLTFKNLIAPDKSFLYTPLVCIKIFKNSLSPGGLPYFPKFFIFDMNKFAIENAYNLPANQIANFNNSWNYNSLRDNFTLFQFNALEQKIVSQGHGQDLYSKFLEFLKDNPDKNTIAKEIVDNHIMDYYLKMYYQLTLGIDMNEYVFPTSLNMEELRNVVDYDMETLFSTYNDNLVVRYPSINVDPDLAREFNRVRQNVINSLFFSAKRKFNNIITPKCFDRVFSIFINEDDFVVDTANIDSFNNPSQGYGLNTVYDPCPIFPLDSSIQIEGIKNSYLDPFRGPQTSQQELESRPAKFGLEAHAKRIKGIELPSLNQYIATVSLVNIKHEE